MYRKANLILNKRANRWIGYVIAMLLFTVVSQLAAARDLWVDRESRGGACRDTLSEEAVTPTTPLCTLAAAAGLVAPGDTVHVRGGTYTEVHQCTGCNYDAVLQLIKAGTATQPIRFIAESGETVTLQGGSSGVRQGVRINVNVTTGVTPSFNEISGVQFRNFSHDCVSLANVPDIKLSNLDVSGCGRQAVALHGAQRVTLEGSRIHDNNTNGWTSAIDLYHCKDGNIVRGNQIWNNSDNSDSEGHGLIMDYCGTSSGAVIENNVIWNNQGWCMMIVNSDGATIRNNTCYQNGTRQDGSGEISTAGNRLAIYNNILMPRTSSPALNIRFSRSGFTADPSTITENYNLFGVAADTPAIQWGDFLGTLAQYQSGNLRGWGAQSMVMF